MKPKKFHPIMVRPTSPARRAKFHLKRILKFLKKFKHSTQLEAAIHKFRVATRKLDAVFYLGRELKKQKEFCKALKTSRTLRKDLGKVRECDVHLKLWEEIAKNKICYKLVSQQINKRRKKELVKVFTNTDLKEIIKPINKALKQNRKDKILRYINPAKKMSYQIDDIIINFKKYQQDHRMEFIHRVRIAAKKLRYTLEEITVQFPNHFDTFISQLKKTQDELGHVHDLETLGISLKRLKAKKSKKWDQRNLLVLQKISDQIKSDIQKNLLTWEGLWLGRQHILTSILKSLSEVTSVGRRAS